MISNCSELPPTSNEPARSSTDLWDRFDRMPRRWRDLVNEYGWNVVTGMIEDGHRNAAKLLPELQAGRARKQEAWLAEIPYPRKSN